jgi:hypothetical protein
MKQFDSMSDAFSRTAGSIPKDEKEEKAGTIRKREKQKQKKEKTLGAKLRLKAKKH